jgi:hypothetical protein
MTHLSIKQYFAAVPGRTRTALWHGSRFLPKWKPAPAHAADRKSFESSFAVLAREAVRQHLFWIIGIGAGAVFIADLMFPVGASMHVLYTAVVLLALWSSRTVLSLALAAGTTALVVVVLFLSSFDGSLWQPVTHRVLSIIGIWLVAILCWTHKGADAERDELVRSLADALSHVKTLQGVLPICASCKRVRDEHDRWHEVEKSFGHGPKR